MHMPSKEVTAWNRVIIGKFIAQLVKIFPDFYGIEMFISTYKEARRYCPIVLSPFPLMISQRLRLFR
jgi:hypothetical protein